MNVSGCIEHKVERNYEIGRTGLNRLCVYIPAVDLRPSAPALILQSHDALLIHSRGYQILLPDFPLSVRQDLMEAKTVLIGEMEGGASIMGTEFDPVSVNMLPVRRFYEARVRCAAVNDIPGEATHTQNASADDTRNMNRS